MVCGFQVLEELASTNTDWDICRERSIPACICQKIYNSQGKVYLLSGSISWRERTKFARKNLCRPKFVTRNTIRLERFTRGKFVGRTSLLRKVYLAESLSQSLSGRNNFRQERSISTKICRQKNEFAGKGLYKQNLLEGNKIHPVVILPGKKNLSPWKFVGRRHSPTDVYLDD